MKKIILGLALSIAAASFVSCDMNDPNDGKFGTDGKAGYVEFTESLTTEDMTFYAGCNVEVPLVLNAPVNTDGIEVYYTITDIEGSSAGLETFASIAANTREGSFVVTNSEIVTSPVEFLVTLTSTNNASVGGKLPDTPDQTMIVRILPRSQAFIATFDAKETSFEGVFDYESDVTQGTTANEYVVSNLYGVNPASETTFTINADGTLSFPAYEDNFLYTATGNVPRFVEGISGTADECSGTIVLNFNLRSGASNPTTEGPYNVVLTRQ